MGGNPDIDVSFQYLKFLFEEDDKKLKKIYDDYKSGKMTTGELKTITIEKINAFLREHQNKINQLAKIGKDFGFVVYTPDVTDDIRDIVQYPLSLPIDDHDKMKRIKEIDLLWIKNNKILYSFEIENSTQISEGIIRGSNIPYRTKRIIVIPESRERLLENKFKNVLLRDQIESGNWSVILYTQLNDFVQKRRKSLEDFDNLLTNPKVEKIKQKTLFE